jgi:hypothetical protein
MVIWLKRILPDVAGEATGEDFRPSGDAVRPKIKWLVR